MKKQYRGGNSGIYQNGVVYGDQPSCLRIILLRHHGIEPGVDERAFKTFTLGNANETYVKGMLERQGKSVKQDIMVTEPISDAVDFVGHADMLTDFALYELKSISSTSSYKKMIEEGKYKISNLAQLLNYMLALEKPYGILRYDSYIYHSEGKGKKIAPAAREYIVEIREDGKVIIDGHESEISVKDVMQHRLQAAYALENNIVYRDRIQPFRDHDYNPCGFCPFAKVCDNFDKKPTNTKNFLKSCKDVVDNNNREDSL